MSQKNTLRLIEDGIWKLEDNIGDFEHVHSQQHVSSSITRGQGCGHYGWSHRHWTGMKASILVEAPQSLPEHKETNFILSF